MNTQLATSAISYTQIELSQADRFDLMEIAEDSAYNRELTRVALDEIAAIGAYTGVKMAQLSEGCQQLSVEVAQSGRRSETFKHHLAKLEDITEHNLSAMANIAQQAFIRKAQSFYR